jgi:hypothetical protein
LKNGLIFLMVAILAAAPARAADLFLNDEPEVYAAIDKLNAAGYLPGLLANTRPYSIQAVRAAAEAASRQSLPAGFDGELLRWLTLHSAPKAMGRLTAAVSHSDARFLPPNNEGIPRPEGWAGQASIAVREEKTPFLSGQLRAAFFHGEGGDHGNRLLDTSIETGYKYATIQAGKISTWYGPGRNGALIFTNNAAPYLGVRIRNPEPIPVIGWLSFLGKVQYDLFAARMEKKPQRSHSTLVGTRLAARPARWLEFGFSRALHYGGEGRSNGVSEFATTFLGNNDPPDRSNSLYGFDITLNVPFAIQPVQAYWERAGEDSVHLGRIFLPWSEGWGNVLGLYLPKALGLSRLDLRVEYADNFSGEAKGDNWYDHSAYPHRYRGDLLGHPMGGSSRDWFAGSRYHFLPAAYAEASYERVLHDGGDRKGERRSIVSAGLIGWVSTSWRAEAHASWDRVTGEGAVPGRAGTDVAAWVALSWQTNVLVPSDTEEIPARGYRGARR